MVLSKDEIGPHSKTGRFLTKAEVLGVGGPFPPLSIKVGQNKSRQTIGFSARTSRKLTLTYFYSVQTRCIVKGEAQKNPLFWRFSGVFDFLRIACSLGIPQENL